MSNNILKSTLKFSALLMLCLTIQACKENNSFHMKEASSVESDNKDGGIIQPLPPELLPPADEEELPGDGDKDDDGSGSEEEKPPRDGEDEEGGDDDGEKTPGDGDSDDDSKDGDCPKDGEGKLPCQDKISSDDLKSGKIKWESIACDNHKVAICHKKSCSKKKDRFELIFIDQHALDAHLSHQDKEDFLLDCKKLNLSHKFLIRKALEDQCNCQK